MAKRWFVVHTYSGYENKVKTDLEHRIETFGVEDKIVDIQIPTEEVTEIKDGGKRETKEAKVFPGYVLVRMECVGGNVDDNLWQVVRNTPGVTGFVGIDGKPTPLRREEFNKIMRRTNPRSGAPAPKQPTDYDGELDPLPPEDYKKGPAWYGSLTDVKKLSNARLIAELKRLQACMEDYRQRDIFFNDPVYAREQDLLDEREDRGEIVAAYDYYVKGYWKDESIRIAYEELVAKYGPADPLRK